MLVDMSVKLAHEWFKFIAHRIPRIDLLGSIFCIFLGAFRAFPLPSFSVFFKPRIKPELLGFVAHRTSRNDLLFV
jgi:hypothetical protein